MQKRGIYFIFIVLGLLGLSLYVDLTVPPRLGLDIAGGIRFTILADKTRLPANARSGEVWDAKAAQVVQILENRAAQGLGVSEANVYRKGDDRFIIELPGFQSEEEARKIITTSARLQYYWASNVTTPQDTTRPYRHDKGTGKNGEETDIFVRNGGSGQTIEPGTPEYKAMLDRWELITEGETLTNAKTSNVSMDGTYNLELSFNGEGARKLNEFVRRHLGREENLAAVLDQKVVSLAYIKKDVTTFGNGQVILEGHFKPSDALRLAALLNAGALPVDLLEENVSKVQPSIGSRALSQILTAGSIAFVLISVFLVAYYVFPGLIALLALIIYTLLAYAVFKWINVTFSLAAIAGFILSIGMAVDANILIFERLKEELRNGRTLLTAIDLGFKRAFPAILDSNACTIITSVVLANIGTGPVKGFATTLMIGVLISLFTAVTVTRSLLLFMVSSGIGRNEKIYGVGRGWFGERLEANANTNPLHISRKMGRYFLISLLVIIPGTIFLAIGGIKPNVEFLGGIEAGVRLPATAPQSSATINDLLSKAGFKDANTKIGSAETGSNRPVAWITVPPESSPEVKRYFELSKAGAKRNDPNVVQELNGLRFSIGQKIVTAVGGDSSIVEKKNAKGESIGKGIQDEVSFESTGPAVRAETIRGAILGVILSSVLIVVYLALRFGLSLGGFGVGLRFGVSAIIAMLHDVLVILGVSAIAGYFMNWEISQLTITAILTVIGFSVHDTIVIFDRIRENLRRPLPGETFDNLVDRSITQSFARSINTSMTVIVTLFILVLVGSATPDLKHFNTAMLIGILSGTYSSIFNAAPILVLWEHAVAKTKGASATIMQNKKLREPEAPAKDETVWREGIDDGGGPDGPGGGRYAPTKRKKR